MTQFYRYCSGILLFLSIGVLGTFPTQAKDSWKIIHTLDTWFFARAMAAYGENTCVVVGSIANPHNNFENGAYIGISTDGGATWNPAEHPLPMKISESFNVQLNAVVAVDSLHWYAAGAVGAVLCSKDGGESWSTMAGIKKWPYHCLSFTSSDTGIVGSRFGGALYRTVDGGTTWEDISRPGASPLQEVLSSSSDTLMILQGDIQAPTMTPSFLRSVDAGKTWQSLGFTVRGFTGNPDKDIRLRDILFLNGKEGYATGRKDAPQGEFYHALVLKTSDGGESWDVVLDTVFTPAGSTFDIERLHKVGEVSLMAVCSDGRVLATEDAGTTWNVVSEPVLAGPFYSASAFPSKNLRYIADGLHQIHKYSAGTSTVYEPPVITALPSVALRPVFPNPVHQSSVNMQVYMRLSHNKTASSLKIYNIYGQEVKDVSNVLKTFSTTPVETVSFDVEGLQNGVYFARISNGEQSAAQGFVVAR